MQSKQHEAMKLALDALEYIRNIDTEVASQIKYGNAAQIIEEALAEQPAPVQQEPVAWPVEEQPDGSVIPVDPSEMTAEQLQRYTTPPQRKPLTNEQIQEVVKKAVRERKLSWLGFKKDDQGEYTSPVLSLSDYQMTRAIEAAHGIKEST